MLKPKKQKLILPLYGIITIPFKRLSRTALRSTQPPAVQCVRGLIHGKERPGREANLSPPSSAVVKKEYSYTCTPPMDHTAYTEPQCLTRVNFTFFTFKRYYFSLQFAE